MKKNEKQTCGNCKFREAYHLNRPCNDCVKAHKFSLNNNWEEDESKINNSLKDDFKRGVLG